MIQYAVIVAFIRTVVEGVEKVIPVIAERPLVSKVLVGAFALVAVAGYGLNAPAEFGLQSKYLWLDYAVSAVALWLAVLVSHDIFAFLNAAKSKAETEAKIIEAEAKAKGIAP